MPAIGGAFQGFAAWRLEEKRRRCTSRLHFIGRFGAMNFFPSLKNERMLTFVVLKDNSEFMERKQNTKGPPPKISLQSNCN